MEFNDCLYIIPSANKPIKVVFEGPPIEDNGDMTFTIRRTATLAEIAEVLNTTLNYLIGFNMTIDEVLNTKFGIFEVTS